MPEKGSINHVYLHRKARVVLSGCVESIYRLFLWPLLQQHRQDRQSTESFFEELFHTDYRRLDRFEVLEDFKVPGYVVQGRHRPTPTVLKGEPILIRADSRDDFVDLQPLRRESEEFCRMSVQDLIAIGPKIRKMRDKRKYNYHLHD